MVRAGVVPVCVLLRALVARRVRAAASRVADDYTCSGRNRWTARARARAPRTQDRRPAWSHAI